MPGRLRLNRAHLALLVTNHAHRTRGDVRDDDHRTHDCGARDEGHLRREYEPVRDWPIEAQASRAS